MQLTSEEIESMIGLVDELCGLYLDDSKGYLVESRLKSIAVKYGCETYAALIDQARRRSNDSVRRDIIDAITTNETLFFRDNSPFEVLKHKIIPELIDQVEAGRRQKSLRFWSAACSTGQEPYSLAMMLSDLIPDIDRWNITILGSDVSNSALEKAEAGLYSELEISRGIDRDVLNRYFVREGDKWKINPGIHRMVRFESRNLLQQFSETCYFDVVMCRNVAIYFKKEQRDDLFRRIVDTLVPGGLLFVGASESLTDLGSAFAPESHCNCTVYRPRPAVSM